MKRIKIITWMILTAACVVITCIASANVLRLPEQTRRIESMAFAGIQTDYVLFPESIQDIAEDAFIDASFVGVGKNGIYAQTWCQNHGFTYQVLGKDLLAPPRVFCKRVGYPVRQQLLYWYPNSFATEYHLCLKDHYSNLTLFKTTTDVLFDCAQLEPGHYTVTVCASDGVLEGDVSNSIDISVPKMTISDQPSVELKADFGKGVYYLEWDPIPGISEYEVLCISNAGEDFGEQAEWYFCETVTETRWEHDLITPNGSIHAIVRAKRSGAQYDEVGPFSEVVSLVVPNAPINCTYHQEDGGFHVSIRQGGYQQSLAGEVLEIPAYIGYFPVVSVSGCTRCAWRKIIIPGTVRRVSGFSYETKYLEEVVLKEGVQEIAANAFYGCRYLRKVTIPSSVVSIGENAFALCSALEDVGLLGSITTVSDGMFANDKLLWKCKLPDTVQTIGTEAFKDCHSMREINFPHGLSEIGANAFYYCKNLKSVILPDSVTSIGDKAFCGCQLSRLTLSANLAVIPYQAFNGAALLAVDVPDGITEIDSMAFSSSLKSIRIPDSVTTLSMLFAGISNVNVYTDRNDFNWIDNDGGSCTSITFAPYDAFAFDMNVSAGTISSSFNQGEPHRFTGYYMCEETISKARVRILNNNNQVLQQSVIEINTNWVLYSLFNNLLQFETLQLGKHWYTIEVQMLGDSNWIEVEREPFTIVSSDFAIYKSADLKLPEGLVPVGRAFTAAGSLRANRIINSIEVIVTDDDQAVIRNYTLTANAYSVTAADILANLNLESFEAGSYELKIMLSSNGGRWTGAQTSFQLFNYDEQLEEGTSIEIISWCMNPNNQYVLDAYNHYGRYLDSIDGWDAAAMVVSNYSDIIRDNVISLFEGSSADGFVVKLYKKVILDMLGSLDVSVNAADVSFDGFDKKIYELTKDLSKTGSITSNAFLANIDEYIDELQARYDGLSRSDAVKIQRYLCSDEIKYFKNLKKSFKSLGTTAHIVGYSKDALEIIALATAGYQQNMAALVTLANAYGDSPSAEFIEALHKVMEEYQDESFVIIIEICDRLKELIVEETMDVIEDGIVILSQAGLHLLGKGGQTVSLTFSIVKFAIDKLVDYTVADLAENDYDFLSLMNLMLENRRAYSRSFEKVKGGDTSAEALKEVLISFQATKMITIKMYDFLINEYPDTASYYQRISSEIKALKIIE